MATYYAKIPMRLPSLNEFIAKTKIHKGDWNAGNELKRMTQANIHYFIKHLPKIEKPVKIDFVWHEQDKKRDPDNIAFAKKFILDALQEILVLPNDNWRYIQGFTDSFVYGDGNYEVEIILKEVVSDDKCKRTAKTVQSKTGSGRKNAGRVR